jgi:DNA polymerase I-like protein with 3'-5' exonuclease and polymerase domains
VELDFNGAELRTLLHLSGHPQPTGDIHDWNQINIFNNNIERDAAKKQIFAWLYNPTSKAVDTDYYDKKKVLSKFYKEGVVSTPFGRRIPSDDFHALNYLIQSTSSDNFLDRASAIQRYCKGLKTNVAFLVHDSIVLDVPFSEKQRIKEIVEIFENTKLGKFKVNINVGKNLGELK